MEKELDVVDIANIAYCINAIALFFICVFTNDLSVVETLAVAIVSFIGAIFLSPLIFVEIPLIEFAIAVFKFFNKPRVSTVS
ncbi:MAG: hypothetical protein LBQ52_03930 [Helicobacteraceae bacterium]|jgi:hypothetical protein|nr:hypothetical protein [Helicobacteraceae bacterium]